MLPKLLSSMTSSRDWEHRTHRARICIPIFFVYQCYYTTWVLQRVPVRWAGSPHTLNLPRVYLDGHAISEQSDVHNLLRNPVLRYVDLSVYSVGLYDPLTLCYDVRRGLRRSLRLQYFSVAINVPSRSRIRSRRQCKVSLYQYSCSTRRSWEKSDRRESSTQGLSLQRSVSIPEHV